MADVTRVDAAEARRKVQSEGALLVCAYPDEDKCNKIKLEGAMNLASFESRVPSLPKDRPIIFYCA